MDISSYSLPLICCSLLPPMKRETIGLLRDGKHVPPCPKAGITNQCFSAEPKLDVPFLLNRQALSIDQTWHTGLSLFATQALIILKILSINSFVPYCVKIRDNWSFFQKSLSLAFFSFSIPPQRLSNKFSTHSLRT